MTIEQKARELAHALGITLYLDLTLERITQRMPNLLGPGHEILIVEPPASAVPGEGGHGRFELSRVAAVVK